MNPREVYTTIQKGNYVAQIITDDNPTNPRTDFDNLGTMVCFHNRMTLGDTDHGFSSPDDFMDYWRENKKDIPVILPIFAYEHGGITISTGRGYPFNDMFDSGQVGYIFVTRDTLKKEYSSKIITKKIKEKAARVLQGEIEEYDQYLTGDVYGYQLFRLDPSNFAEDEEFDSDCDDPEDYGEELDSCWGFYGIDSVKEEVNSMIDYYLTKETA